MREADAAPYAFRGERSAASTAAVLAERLGSANVQALARRLHGPSLPDGGMQEPRQQVFHPGVPRLWCCAVIVWLTAAPVVRADELEGRELFARARDLRVQGNCASALPVFRQARDAYPDGLGSLRNIAECEEALGHFASARRAWLDLGRLLLTNDEIRYRGWELDAAQAAERLTPNLGRLTIELRAVTPSGGPALTPGVDVSVNGEPLDPAGIGHPLEVDPGAYVVRAVGAGSTVASERKVVIAAGDEKRVELRVAVPSPPDEDATKRSKSSLRTAAWIAAGFGAASFVGAGIAGIERRSALDDLNAECGSTTTCFRAPNNPAESSKVRGIEDRGHAAATWVNVLAIVGGVGLAGGVALYAAGDPHAPRAGVLLSPAGIYAVGSY